MGDPPISHLQRYVEHNTVLWSMLDELSVTTPPPSSTPPGVVLPSTASAGHLQSNKGPQAISPGFELSRFLAT
ncbi:hypothetical protein FRC03_009575 [Tulasnella sp. 419]|nr:hypothetical protein FRC03_009575 [Tulasnella sp. 419]